MPSGIMKPPSPQSRTIRPRSIIWPSFYATATNQEVRSSKMAVQLATRACDATTSQNAPYMDTLARAYAADGDFFQAIAWEDKAVRRAAQLGDHDLLREFQPRFNLFTQHKAE